MDSINRRAFFMKKHMKKKSIPSQYQENDLSPAKRQHCKTDMSPVNKSNKIMYDLLKKRSSVSVKNCDKQKMWLTSQGMLLNQQKHILLKVIEGKLINNAVKKKQNRGSSNTMMITRYTRCDKAQSLQLKLNKPTDKKFHQLQNVRLAEKLLFVKPSKEISNSTHSSFYRQQKQYKLNISRMPINYWFRKNSQSRRKEWSD